MKTLVLFAVLLTTLSAFAAVRIDGNANFVACADHHTPGSGAKTFRYLKSSKKVVFENSGGGFEVQNVADVYESMNVLVIRMKDREILKVDLISGTATWNESDATNNNEKFRFCMSARTYDKAAYSRWLDQVLSTR